MAKVWGHWRIRWGKDKRRAKSHSPAFTPLSNTTHCETSHISIRCILIIIKQTLTSDVRNMISFLKLSVYFSQCCGLLSALEQILQIVALLLNCFGICICWHICISWEEGRAGRVSLAARLNSGHWAHSPASHSITCIICTSVFVFPI